MDFHAISQRRSTCASQNSMAFVCSWLPNDNRENHRKESQLLPPQLAWAVIRFMALQIGEKFIILQTRESLIYRDFKNLKVGAAGTEVCTGRKWSAGKELGKAVGFFKQRALMGMVAKPRKSRDKILSRKRSMITLRVKEDVR